ncbi:MULTISPECIES: hypothetical protein [unclassified Rathayibacter]|uniref:hypothetical protein n=1 Tax=unclassified Rathayibacter TaxID=2609250 RepID=UPI00188C1D41|nr:MULTISPECIES: hypothetical protein [unclassified Rathayibacter]MBF4463165.1 hypothetical protein [Rathayibacter sp. VKM Ac-2879]MBF4504598.1 hypothetical protein [Rathayibacter sp. VKM Ac-2878]
MIEEAVGAVFGVVEQSTAVVLVAMSCPTRTEADRQRVRWEECGCSRPGLGGSGGASVLTGAFPSVFDALTAVGAVCSDARPGGGGSVAIASGSAGPGTGGEMLAGRVSALLASAGPGECLATAEVALLAGPLLGAGLDLVDSGRRERREPAAGPVDAGAAIVYEIRPTEVAGRLTSCSRLDWARRRLHGAPARPRAVDRLRPASRITSLVAEDEGTLEVAIAQAALGAHSAGAHVLRSNGRADGGRLLSAVVELLAAYAEDRGSSLARGESAHEWAAVSRSLPEIAHRSGLARKAEDAAAHRASPVGRETLDLLDRLLRSVAAAGPVALIITAVKELDPLSRVLIERVLGDRRLPDVRLVLGAIGEEPAFVDRLRRRLGDHEVQQVVLTA